MEQFIGDILTDVLELPRKEIILGGSFFANVLDSIIAIHFARRLREDGI